MFYDRNNMYYLRDILRLYTGKYSIKEIANMYNISQQTVLNYISLFKKHGLSWPLSDEFANDQVLAEKLELKKSMPISLDFEIISNKLQQRGMILKYLYNKLFEEKKITFSYKYFQKLYKMWSNKQPSYMIQDYKVLNVS